MRQLAAAFATAVRKHVLPELERFARQPEEKTDAADGDASSVVARARRSLSGQPERIGPVAVTVGDRVAKNSQNEFKRLGIKLRAAEPKFDRLITGWRRENVDKITSLVGHELDVIEKLLRDGEGRRVESLRADIEGRFDVTRSKAELLARDQVLKLNGQITHERQKAAGIEEYIWTAAGDERVREMHADLDGTRQRWDDPPVTNEAGDRNHPGEDYQCRCTAYPVLPELGDDSDAEAPERPGPDSAPAPESEEPPAEPTEAEPLFARMAEFSDKLLKSSRPGDAREIVRAQLTRAMPGATSRDLLRPGVGELRVERMQPGVRAYHDPNGSIAVGGDVMRESRAALRFFAEGTYGEDFRDIDPTPGKIGPIEALNGLRTIVHEEVHGHSRGIGRSYRGIGRVLEEVGTESTAQHVVRNLTPDISRNPHLHNPQHFGAYAEEVKGVRSVLMRRLDIDEAGADELIRRVHREKICGPGEPFESNTAHLRAFLDGLDQPAETTQLIRDDLLRRFVDE